MKNKKITLSIVIPVYNEESYIADCLDAIATQSERPDEVIVVDNNCTDSSINIAKQYQFVKIIKEPRQSQVYAQKKGFDTAKGDVIGRIDADSVLPKNWVKHVKEIFSKEPRIVAILGGARPYDVELKHLAVSVFRFYNIAAGLIGGATMIWGGNSALRRSAWLTVTDKVLQRPDIWEDFDLSLLIKDMGDVRFVQGIRVGVSFRAIHKPVSRQLEYQFRAVRTFAIRTSYARATIFGLVWSTMLLFYPIVLLDQYLARSVKVLLAQLTGKS